MGAILDPTWMAAQLRRSSTMGKPRARPAGADASAMPAQSGAGMRDPVGYVGCVHINASTKWAEMRDYVG
jgi:hypothetical protein